VTTAKPAYFSRGRIRRGSERDGQARPRYGVGFWVVAAAFLTAMAFSTIPTPLYPLYQQRDRFSAFVVTIVFAVYAVGVVASLLLAGQVSDWIGRKRIMLPALAILVLSAVIFLVWPTLPGLIVARLVNGIGIGLMAATATAYVRDLDSLARPGAGTGRFEVVDTAANLGGLGVGTLAAGALAQFVPLPLEVPYAVFAVLLVICIAGLSLVPETVRAPAVRPGYRPQRITIAGADRASVTIAAAGAFAGFAVFGLFTSLAPAFVGSALHHPSRLLAGVVAFICFGSAALAQTATGGLGNRSRLLLGVVTEAIGVVVVAVGMEETSLAPFLVGGALAGAGAGVLFKSAVATLLDKAEPAKRGEAATALFLFAYLGMTIPALAIGVATLFVTATTAMLFFAVALLLLLFAITLLVLRPRGGKVSR
jgi:MFS family permease